MVRLAAALFLIVVCSVAFGRPRAVAPPEATLPRGIEAEVPPLIAPFEMDGVVSGECNVGDIRIERTHVEVDLRLTPDAPPAGHLRLEHPSAPGPHLRSAEGFATRLVSADDALRPCAEKLAEAVVANDRSDLWELRAPPGSPRPESLAILARGRAALAAAAAMTLAALAFGPFGRGLGLLGWLGLLLSGGTAFLLRSLRVVLGPLAQVEYARLAAWASPPEDPLEAGQAGITHLVDLLVATGDPRLWEVASLNLMLGSLAAIMAGVATWHLCRSRSAAVFAAFLMAVLPIPARVSGTFAAATSSLLFTLIAIGALAAALRPDPASEEVQPVDAATLLLAFAATLAATYLRPDGRLLAVVFVVAAFVFPTLRRVRVATLMPVAAALFLAWPLLVGLTEATPSVGEEKPVELFENLGRWLYALYLEPGDGMFLAGGLAAFGFARGLGQWRLPLVLWGAASILTLSVFVPVDPEGPSPERFRHLARLSPLLVLPAAAGLAWLAEKVPLWFMRAGVFGAGFAIALVLLAADHDRLTTRYSEQAELELMEQWLPEVPEGGLIVAPVGPDPTGYDFSTRVRAAAMLTRPDLRVRRPDDPDLPKGGERYFWHGLGCYGGQGKRSFPLPECSRATFPVHSETLADCPAHAYDRPGRPCYEGRDEGRTLRVSLMRLAVDP